MPIQRNHSRRRRVFLDESVQSEMAQTPTVQRQKRTRGNSTAPKLYADAAKHDKQLRITDLIPQSSYLISAIVVSCLIFVSLLNYLAFSVDNWSGFLSAGAIETLSFTAPGSIGSWFSSLILLMTSFASLQIYAMRRHRNDDYSGTYRIWLWLAIVFALASVNSVVNFKSVFDALTSAAGYSSRTVLLAVLGIKFVALNVIAIRTLIEIRPSKAAGIAGVMAWIAYASALAAQLPFATNTFFDSQNLILGNTMLVGMVSCFTATMIFARFIYLHANELLEVETVAPKKSAAKSDATAKSDAAAQRGATENKSSAHCEATTSGAATDPDAAKPSPTKSTEPVIDHSQNHEMNQEILSLEANQQLSKAERRRLKKLQKRQRRAA